MSFKTKYQYIFATAGSLSALSCGLHYGWPSPSLPILLDAASEIPVTTSEGSWLSVINVIAGAFSCILGCIITDKIGRKLTLLLTSPVYVISWLVIAYASTVKMLLCGRFIAGVADGVVLCCLPMYIGEIATAKIRGQLGTYMTIALALGTLVINMIGSYCSIKSTALICLSVPALHFITFYWAPETPYFLIVKGKIWECKQSLTVLKGETAMEEDITALQCEVDDHWKNKANALDLFTERSNRKAFFIIVGLYAVQYLSGSSAITFYIQIIIQETGKNISSAASSNIFFFLNLFMACFSAVLVDKTGRRPLLLLSTLSCCICLAAGGLYFYFQLSNSISSVLAFTPITFLIIYVIMFNLGIGTIPLMILGELFPTNVKAVACCLANIYSCVLVILASKFFQIMNDNFGMHLPFFIFSGVCLLGFFYIIIYVPETKKKTLEEIQQCLKRTQHYKSIEMVY